MPLAASEQDVCVAMTGLARSRFRWMGRRASLRFAAATAAVSLVPLTGGAADSPATSVVDRGAYIRANLAMLDALPLPPHGRILVQQSVAQYTGFDPPGQIRGYLTSRYYAQTQRGTSWKAVDSFFQRRLATRWTLRNVQSCARFYRRGRAMLVVKGCTRGMAFALLLDHKAYGP